MDATYPMCSIERTLGVVGERWTFLILREALFNGVSRFADFQSALGIAPNVLTSRLTTIVEAGVLEKREYREDGARTRYSYHPTAAGTQLAVVLAALQQWGDEFLPRESGPTVLRQTSDGSLPVRVGFVDGADRPLDLEDVSFVRSPAYGRVSP